jgi:predicted kinase
VTTLIITRGLPGSGKSTWARQWVSEDPKGRAEVNRDMLRVMMHGGYADAEVMVTQASHAAIRELLKRGVDVVCSDTNLPQRTARDLAKIARLAGAEVEVRDMTDVPLGTCIERDSYRSKALGDEKNPVGEEVIRRMHARYIAGKGYPMPLPVEDETVTQADFVQRVPGLRRAALVDIDGTVALMGDRGPYDYTRVHLDRPNHPVIEVVHALYLAGEEIIFMSGRSDGCRTVTEDWLHKHVQVAFLGPYMRREGDMRKDSIVKRELFDRHVRGKYNITAVLDDRDQVVRMWRDELGLTCLQVAPGNF